MTQKRHYLLVTKINKKIYIHMLSTGDVHDDEGYIWIDKKTFERLKRKNLVFIFDENTPKQEMVKELGIEEYSI